MIDLSAADGTVWDRLEDVTWSKIVDRVTNEARSNVIFSSNIKIADKVTSMEYRIISRVRSMVWSNVENEDWEHD